MAQPAEVQAIADELIVEYQTVADIIDRFNRDLVAHPQARRTLIARLRSELGVALDQTDDVMRAWLAERFPTVYVLGANVSAKALGLQLDPFALTNSAALQRMINDLFDDLLTATRFVRRDVKRFIAESAKLIAEGKLRDGETAVHAGARLTQILEERGIRGITYKNGSRHSIDEYAQTVIRSKTAVAYNTGTLDAASNAGVAFYELADGFGCGLTSHDDPETANGMIVDENTARSWPISHPNCTRAVLPRPDLTSTKGAPSTTAAQRADQKAFEIARAVNRPARQRRQPRTPRHAA